jgi:hypothetical protein
MDPYTPVAGVAAVVTVAITLHHGGLSTHETVIACSITAAIFFVLGPAVYAVTNRLLPSRDSLTWWQWWQAINVVPKMLMAAIVYAVGGAVVFAAGDWRWGLGFGVAAAVSALWARWYLHRLRRRVGDRS